MSVTDVSIHIDAGEKVSPGQPDAELDRLSRQLRRELLELDVENVTFERDDEVPAGAKGDAATVSTLIVSLANSAGLVGICQVIRSWVNRDRDRRVVLKDGERSLELTGASADQQQQVIDAFLATYQQ